MGYEVWGVGKKVYGVGQQATGNRQNCTTAGLYDPAEAVLRLRHPDSYREADPKPARPVPQGGKQMTFIVGVSCRGYFCFSTLYSPDGSICLKPVTSPFSITNTKL
jgi:hypothetical protein